MNKSLMFESAAMQHLLSRIHLLLTPLRLIGLLPRCHQCLRGILLVVSGMLLTPSIQAHPHAWVDIKTHIVGENGYITGFKMAWTFDENSSADMLQDELVSAASEQQRFPQLATSLLQNMRDEHYFTYFYGAKGLINFNEAYDEQLTRDGEKLILSFELPLKQAKQATAASWRLLIFEATNYVDMAWKSAHDIVLSEALDKQCELHLIEPTPVTLPSRNPLYVPIDAIDSIVGQELGRAASQTAQIECVILDPEL